jgi:uracil-DNA glycosylase
MLSIEVGATYPDEYKMVVVGEAPGADEVEAKEGFVGVAGRCLEKACTAAGISWPTVARSNVAKRRPGANHNNFRTGFYQTIEEPIYTPTGKLSKRTSKTTLWTPELSEWVDLLADELREHNPNLVVAAGNEALSAITGLSGITNYRGSILGSRGRFMRPDGSSLKVLAVEHPSYVLRQPTDFWVLAHDLKKAKREAEFPEIHRLPWTAVSDPLHDLGSILAYIRYIGEHPQQQWTLDVETRAGTLACFGCGYRLADGSLFAFCVPLQTTKGPYWTPEQECEIWRELSHAARANPNLCNQNIEYDLYYLLRYGVEPSGVYMDTMLAHSILYPEFPKGLDFLCSFYLDDVVYYKGEGRDWSAGDRDEDLWAYNCKDDAFTLRVVEKIDAELKHRGWYEQYHGFSVHD